VANSSLACRPGQVYCPGRARAEGIDAIGRPGPIDRGVRRRVTRVAACRFVWDGGGREGADVGGR